MPRESLIVARGNELKAVALIGRGLERRRGAIYTLELVAIKYRDDFAVRMLRHIVAEGDERTQVCAIAALKRMGKSPNPLSTD